MQRAVVLGASGGIGSALTRHLAELPATERVYALSRSRVSFNSPKVQVLPLPDYSDTALGNAAQRVSASGAPTLVLVATGLLHDDARGITPEKNTSSLITENLRALLEANTVVPALAAKHFLPLLDRKSDGIFAALSARVGSIGDNHLGGWHSYRASKAALNMLLKTMAIEHARKNPRHAVIGLHPGTVDTGLSAPFQGNVPEGKLFDTARAARQLIGVLQNVRSEHTGRVLDWQGTVVPY